MRSRNGAVSDEHGITLRMTCNMTTYRYSFKMIVFLSLMFGQAAPDADVFRDWYSWHMECHRNNQTMLSWPMWMERGRSDLNVTYPVWFYGVEIHLLTGLTRTFKISQLENHKEARTRYTSSFEPGLFVLDTAKSLCAKKLSTTIFSIPNISPTNLNDFQIAADIIQVPFWVQPVNVQAFVGAPITTLLCYLLDLDGLVKKENCSEKYSSVCVNATAHDTITYLGSTSSVPFYRSALTSSSRAKRLTDILLTIPITVFSVFIAMNRLFDNLS
ncbi:uncharacterized protein LOC127843071 isoform X2 [Dreissena polymorpha]|uniref:uncharacterized protein LOC127843071 isoform X2 n=1 Tax=Dreissena polymorpha TaxID=45954 RepID=UPI00226421BD|nr:uncharacterized protein LOC127843071 isoform X2 [Dreissena polymorpha]